MPSALRQPATTPCGTAIATLLGGELRLDNGAPGLVACIWLPLGAPSVTAPRHA
jgi:hypothetical protein